MIAEKKYVKPSTLKEALETAAENLSNSRFIAGGTDVIVNAFQGTDESSLLIDITALEELKGIRKEGNNLHIGALTRLDELKKNSDVKSFFPALAEAAHSVGSPLIRKTATIGGNILCENRCIYYNQSEWWREAVGYCLKCKGDICIATGGNKACFSEFVSDTAPVLISMNAEIKIADAKGEHTVKLEKIYTGDGVKPRAISNTSLVKEIILPLDNEYRCVFKKLRQRESLEFTSLTTAVAVNNQGDMRIVLGGVDPKPVLVTGKITDNKDDLIKKAIKGARAVNNDMFSRDYRRQMIRIYLTESFEQLTK